MLILSSHSIRIFWCICKYFQVQNLRHFFSYIFCIRRAQPVLEMGKNISFTLHHKNWDFRNCYASERQRPWTVSRCPAAELYQHSPHRAVRFFFWGCAFLHVSIHTIPGELAEAARVCHNSKPLSTSNYMQFFPLFSSFWFLGQTLAGWIAWVKIGWERPVQETHPGPLWARSVSIRPVKG